MNKSELIEKIASQADMTKVDATRALDAMISSITEELKHGGSLQLTGFGTFKVNNRAERTGRNPQTGETITIKAAKVPAFSASKSLKEAVNQ